MSTNLNNNNSSQTLFRFAAMRNPELSDPKNKERRFVFRKDTQKGIFDQKLNALTSLQRLCEDPSVLATLAPIATEKSLRELNPAVYELAVWIARNKATTSKTEFDAKINAFTALGTQPTTLGDSYFWDNLIYQVVTQKDFYAKETLMQFLHLNHILEKYDGTEEAFEDVKKAKVVLPKELFKASTSDALPTGISTAQKSVFNNKNMKFAESTVQLKENQQLADTLSKLEKNYTKSYDAAYKSTYSQYEREIKPVIQTLQKDTAEADRKKQILENRINYLTQLSVADPEKFYANAELDMELHRIKDEIMEITVPDTEIPEFEFTYEVPEIDPAQIAQKLTPQEQGALCRVFGASTVAEALSGVTTFEELHENINQSNQVLQQTVLNNTVIQQQVSANVGGVVIPVTNNTSTGYVPFSVKTYARSSTEWSLILSFSNNLEIVSANYKATVKNTEISSTSLSSLGGGSYLLFDMPRIPVSQTTAIEQFVLEGEFTLATGATYTFNVTMVIDPNDMDRMTKEYHFRGAGGCEPLDPPKETPENPEVPSYSPPETSSFIPSGFGMKNIGVADYLKVEQSIQGYVEGEVAHIENVMARERREKATKKTSKSEITTMESSDTEKEQLRDSSSTDRFEMQNEIAKAIQEVKDANISAYVNGSNDYGTGTINYGVAGGFSTHNSKEENIKQAMTQAKEITQKATDRVITKVHKERTEKMIEEFEETNIHEFDNRKGDKHVIGVYRWVDKVYKNQIYNYGKRMMFEFMIPEPAKLHNLGMKISKNLENRLIKPLDPRSDDVQQMQMKDFTSLNGVFGDAILKYWAGIYNVELKNFTRKINVTLPISFSTPEDYKDSSEFDEVAHGNFELEIPEGYSTTGNAKIEAAILAHSYYDPGFGAYVCVGNVRHNMLYTSINASIDAFRNSFTKNINNLNKYTGSVGVSYSSEGFHAGNINVDVECELNEEGLQTIFNKIIAAYEKAKTKYDQDLAVIQVQGEQIKGSNPGFYRQIENTILRRNCISYMINQDPSALLTFGKNKYYKTNSAEESFLNTEIKLDWALHQYTSFVKFMEQAFEWEIMSYYFYPYYWGNRNNWDKMYQFDDNDPTFRAFMQSGMARVIVTVRPGFEESVRHFLATGQIWNGGEVPVIDDPLFLSIVDEMRKTEGEKYGKAWATRLPTALTILQAQSIGLNVDKALPFDENLSDYEDPTKVPHSSQIELSNAQMGGDLELQKLGSISGRIQGLDGLSPEIMLKNKDKSPVDFTNPNDEGDFWLENIPVGKYEICLDENDDFENNYNVEEGKITRVIEVKEKQTTQVNLVVSKI